MNSPVVVMAEPGASSVVRMAASEQVSVDSFEVLAICGTGAYGRVLMVRSKLDGRIYAMKCVDKTNIVQKASALPRDGEARGGRHARM